jgi:hypothetical protein
VPRSEPACRVIEPARLPQSTSAPFHGSLRPLINVSYVLICHYADFDKMNLHLFKIF